MGQPVVFKPLVGGPPTIDGQRTVACTYMPTQFTGESGLPPVYVQVGDMANTDNQGDHTLSEYEASVKSKGCPSTYTECGVRDTPSLGPGTFMFYSAIEAGGVRIAGCSVVIHDIGETPLQITAGARTGGTFPRYSGDTSIPMLCRWATGIATALM